MRGTNVCRVHGGMAPQVRAKAEQRILEAADPAAAKIISLMQDKKVPYAVQLAAARDLLDRAGITKTQHVAVEVVKQYEQLAASGAVVMDFEIDEAEIVVDADEANTDDDWVRRIEGPVSSKRRRRDQGGEGT